MKRITALALGALAIGRTLAGVEISSTFNFGNLAFGTDRKSPLSAEAKDFDGVWAYGGALEASERVGENFLFSAGLDRDPLLGNTIFTRIGYDAGFARISVGPFFGPFNTTDSVLTSGISTILRVEKPGIVYASFRSDSTIGAGLAATGDYVQEQGEILVGFWVPNLLVSARLASKAFTLRKTSDLTIADERTRYELVVEAFKKNVPYTVTLNMGYENLKRRYEGSTAGDDAADELGAAIVGMEVNVQATDYFRFILGAEGALYAWGIGDLGSPSNSRPFFTARAGITFVIPEASEAPALEPAAAETIDSASPTAGPPPETPQTEGPAPSGQVSAQN